MVKILLAPSITSPAEAINSSNSLDNVCSLLRKILAKKFSYFLSSGFVSKKVSITLGSALKISGTANDPVLSNFTPRFDAFPVKF